MQPGGLVKVTCTALDPKVAKQDLYDLEREIALKFADLLIAVGEGMGAEMRFRSLTMIDDHEDTGPAASSSSQE